MSKIAKTIVAIAPLAITQISGGYFIYKTDNLAAREGIGSLLFICIGTYQFRWFLKFIILLVVWIHSCK